MYTRPRQNFYSRKGQQGNGNGYYPRRPLHSFQDLEVYQKALECSVMVAKEVNGFLASRAKMKKKQPENANLIDELIMKNMLPCALGIPHQVAEAHSLRFGDHTAGIAAIEKAMLGCNKMVVYLEQFRDICVRPVRGQTPEASADAQAHRTSHGEYSIPWEFFDDMIKKYIYVRRKMLRLEQAWKKFMPGHEQNVGMLRG